MKIELNKTYITANGLEVVIIDDQFYYFNAIVYIGKLKQKSMHNKIVYYDKDGTSIWSGDNINIVKEKQPDITEQLSKEMEILKAEVQFLKNDNAVLRQQIEYWKQS
jgi:hypothetical protein